MWLQHVCFYWNLWLFRFQLEYYYLEKKFKNILLNNKNNRNPCLHIFIPNCDILWTRNLGNYEIRTVIRKSFIRCTVLPFSMVFYISKINFNTLLHEQSEVFSHKTLHFSTWKFQNMIFFTSNWYFSSLHFKITHLNIH